MSFIAGCLAADSHAELRIAPEKLEELAFRTAVSAGSDNNISLLKPLAHLGEGIYFYLALKAFDAKETDAALLCLEAGLLYENNPVYKSRIRSLLAEIYYNKGAYEKVLALTNVAALLSNQSQILSPSSQEAAGQSAANQSDGQRSMQADAVLQLSQKEKLLRARALRDTAAYADALSAWKELQKSKPSGVSPIEIEEALLEALAGTDVEANAKQIQEKVALLVNSSRSTALTDALERLLVFTGYQPVPEVAKQLLIRVFVGRQDYGSAVRIFKNFALTSEQGTLKKLESEIPPQSSHERTVDSAGSVQPTPTPLVQSVQVSVDSSAGTPASNTPASSTPTSIAPGTGGASTGVSGVTGAAEPSLQSLRALFETFSYTTQADLCRAYQYSDADAGLKLFSVLFEQSPKKEVKFLAAYYSGLIARDKKIYDSAVSWFSKAEQYAFTPDTDNQAVWYQIDILAEREPAKALAKLTLVLKRTNRPDYFADVIERMSRNALADKNGSQLASIDASVFAHGSGALKARMAYIAGRAAQAGIITQKHLDAASAKTTLKSFIEQRLNWAQTQNSELWFKMLAAYRLGLALVPDSWKQGGEGEQWGTPGTNSTIFTALEERQRKVKAAFDHAEQSLAPQPVPKSNGSQTAQAQTSVYQPDEYQFALYFSGLVRWGLSTRVIDELEQYPVPEHKSVQNLRALADYLYKQGEYNLAIRVITELLKHSDYTMQDFDRKIYWPLAYPEAMQSALAPRSLNKWIYYALIRSESLFKPDAVSRSGAIGLGQFMPATAKDVANRLKMETYDLTKPADNLFMSAYYFQILINQFEGQVLPAVWSYNAGPSRYLQWKKQFGSLPFDLFMEAIPFAETRQYGKNIGRAAVLYAALHEKSDGKALLAYYLGEKSQP